MFVGQFLASQRLQVHASDTRCSSHVAVSVLIGGPFYCAYANAITAQTACMRTPDLIDVGALVQITRNTELTHTIDPLSNVKTGRVYLFSGSEDTVVVPGVVGKLEQVERPA